MPSARSWLQKFSPSSPKRTISYEFRGIDGFECEEFIRKVRARAFQKGKQEDRKWMASFAATCFAGPALRWHSGLNVSVKTDWALLEQALLEKYPHTDDTDPFRRSTIPTPAAIPVAPSASMRNSRASPYGQYPMFSSPEIESVETFGETSPTPKTDSTFSTPATGSSLSLASPQPLQKSMEPMLSRVGTWPTAVIPDTYLCWAQALFHYKAKENDPNEISLEKGELIEVIDSSGNWWQARKADGTEGYAPSNYLEVMGHI